MDIGTLRRALATSFVVALFATALVVGTPATSNASLAQEFNVPSGSPGLTTSSGPGAICVGADGNLWFVETERTNIARITTDGDITEFDVGARPTEIAAGPDGYVWFTASGFVGKITPSGIVTKYTGLAGGVLTAGPDGNIWLTNGSSVEVVTTGGVLTATYATTGAIGGITVGPDGNLWFTETWPGEIGTLTPTGTLTEYAVPGWPSGPAGITSGPDGNLWFADDATSQIGRITPSGTLTMFDLPTKAVSSDPVGITNGPDGNLWFTEYIGNKIGSITPSGAIHEYAKHGAPWGIAAGPDGNLWFTESDGNAVVSTPTTVVAPKLTKVAGSKLDEYHPVGNADYLAWSQNSAGAHSHYDVFAEPLGGSPVKVNPAGTAAYTGGIDGNTLAYEQVSGGDGSIKLYDLATQTISDPPASVNTAAFEYSPSISGTHLIFGRYTKGLNNEQLILTDTTTGKEKSIATVLTFQGSLYPGQVNGDYIAWTECLKRCDVFRYRISTATTTLIHNANHFQYSASVTKGEAVFFVRGGTGCGDKAEIDLAGVASGSKVIALPRGTDATSMFATRDPGGKPEVIVGLESCKSHLNDIYALR